MTATKAYIYGPTLFGGTAPIEQITCDKRTPFISSIPSGVQDVFSSTGTLIEKAAYSTYGVQAVESGYLPRRSVSRVPTRMPLD